MPEYSRWRRKAAWAALTVLACGAALCQLASGGSTSQDTPKKKATLEPGTVVELTESNFDRLLQRDIWLVDVYAPWCSHCRQLEPVWNALAAQLKSQPEIRVGKVDGPRNRGIMQQLAVEAFPSIYLVRDGSCWIYNGPRSTDAFIKFATSGYKSETPLPPHRCPTHILGRVLGQVHRMPSRVKNAYKYLKEENGWSDLTILIAVLGVPVISGVATICLVDAMYLRKARRGDEDELAEVPPGQPAEAAAIR